MYPPPDAEPFPTLGPGVCQFIEEWLVHGPGDLFGVPVVLNDEQRAWIYRMYEVEPRTLAVRRGGRLTRPANPRAGRRRFERCVLSLRKGSSKTELAAWIAACELHPDAPVRFAGWTTAKGVEVPEGKGVTDPYIPMVSYTEEQTEELAYGALRRILEESSLAGDFDIGLERIMRIRGDGKAEAVSGSPNARDGARTTFQHADEALALDTPLPTPTGWTTMGAVRVGDDLVASTGKPCRVVGKSDVHEGRPCYRVTFTDGTSVVADEGHLWYARRRGGCGHGQGCRCELSQGWAVRRTVEMLDTRFDAGKRPAYRYHVPAGEAMQTPEIELPVDPYALGLWLGDGDERNATVSVGAVDAEETTGLLQRSGYVVTACAARNRAPLLYVTTPGYRTSLVGRLRRMGVLGRKHIPAAYLRAGTNQRLALLQGLMDSDGHVSKRGDCVFVNTSGALIEAVTELCRTLGFAPSVHWREDDRKESYRRVGKVAFQADREMPVFRLARKVARLRGRRHSRHMVRAIVSVEPVESVPVQCVKVDAPDSLFRSGVGMVLTHNTHRWTLDHLKRAWSVMLANQGKRPIADPWALETTTAPEPGGGSVAESTMNYARKVAADPPKTSPRLFFYHREASESHDLTKDAGLKAAIKEASGPYIVKWTDVDRIVQLFRSDDADPAYVERVWLNRLVQASAKAFDAALWKELVRPGYVVPKGSAIALGFDGSRYEDATGLVGTELETGHQWVLGVWQKPETIEDWEVNVAEVNGVVEDAFTRWSVARMYCDPPKWESWVSTWAGKHGDKKVVEWWTNRRRPMAYALRSYRGAMEAGELTHDGDKTFAQHIGNSCRSYTTLTDEEEKPLWLLRKERPDSPWKIDLAMAGCLSWEARNDAIAAGAQTPNYDITFLGVK